MRDLPPVATPEQVRKAELALGFDLPRLLKSCYLEIANGGFGPGYGVIGLEGGYASDFGDIVSTSQELKNGAEVLGGAWQPHLLPFNEWGCNIFSCVQCSDEQLPIFTFEEGKVWQQNFGLNEFIEMWINGEDVLRRGAAYEIEEVTTTNPFTGAQMTVRSRKRIR
jgi:SMI1 / KNR4 family (SUKH-1)